MLGVVAAVLGLGAIVIVALIKRRGVSPTQIATGRLDAQIAHLRGDLAALNISGHNFANEQEGLARQWWIDNQLATTPIEAIDVPGMGPAAHALLRANGVSYLRDLPHLTRPNVKIATIGLKKVSALIAAYHAEGHRLRGEAERMNRAALDDIYDGRLTAAIDRHDLAELMRLRRAEGLRIRIVELESRRKRLLTS